MHLDTKNKVVFAIEIVVAVAVIAFDLWIPTIVILAIIAVSLLIHKEKIS